MEVDKEDEHKVKLFIVTKNVNNEWSDTKSVYETLKVVNKLFEE